MRLFISASPFLFISGIVLPPLLTAILCLVAKGQSRRLGNLTFIASILSFLFSAALLWAFLQSNHGFQITLLIFKFSIDALSVYFILLVTIVALFVSYFTRFTIGQGGEIQERYDKGLKLSQRFHLQFNLLYCSMLLVPMVDNLLLLWILMVFTTVVSAPLIGYRPDQSAQEAAWKYFIITSVGIVLALLGIIFLLGAFHESPTIILNWSDLIDGLKTHSLVIDQHSQEVVKLSFLLILLGYGTKAGLFPMHTWLPDVLGEAPSSISALLSGVLLKSALYVILRFYIITNVALTGPGGVISDHFASNALLIFGLFSLMAATLFILNTKKENRYKHVLAYLSLEHMGIITFGFGLGTSLAFFGALFHTLNHALSKTLMFLTYGNIQAAYAKETSREEEILGVFRTMPIMGCLLALSGLTLVGAPPFSISLSTLMIVWAALQRAVESPFWIIAICLFLISVALVFAAMVVHLGRIVLGRSSIQPIRMCRQRQQLVVLGILSFLLIFGGFTTFPLTALLQQSVKILCQGGCP